MNGRLTFILIWILGVTGTILIMKYLFIIDSLWIAIYVVICVLILANNFGADTHRYYIYECNENGNPLDDSIVDILISKKEYKAFQKIKHLVGKHYVTYKN